MDKEEILAKSRAENKKADVYEQEIMKQANAITVTVMMILAAVFFFAQMLVGGGMNWGIWAIVFSVHMTRSWVNYVKMRNKNELGYAIAFTILVAVASGYHIYNLISTSTIL